MPEKPGRRAGTPRRRNASSGAALLARLYDLDLAGDEGSDPGDLDLYLALAAQLEGPILELAAGSGRIVVPLAAAGHAVVGVDRDAAMLARARAAWAGADKGRARGSLELVEADLRSVELGARFDLVILALNGLLLMGNANDQQAALSAMARHLRPGHGRAVVDVWLPGPDDLAAYDGRLVDEWQRPDPESGDVVAKLSSARFEPATAEVELVTLFDSWPAGGGPLTRVARTDRMRLLGPAELAGMAAAAGLRTEQLAGDYGLSPFGPGAERVVLVAGLV
ncbi:MAG: class I SAM-dependent methyltransferase [Candidatus Limnocylindrales bacterium]